MSRTSFRTRLALASGSALLLAALATGCGAISSMLGGSGNGGGSDSGTGGDTASVFDLTVGDCLNEPEASDGEIYDVEIVPCADLHDYEVYHEYALDLGASWPGKADIEADAQATCAEEFETFVGVPFNESAALWYSYYSPTETSWEQGDDKIQCLVYEASDDEGASIVEVEGTLEGSKR